MAKLAQFWVRIERGLKVRYFGRDWGNTGHRDATRNRSFLTQSDFGRALYGKGLVAGFSPGRARCREKGR